MKNVVGICGLIGHGKDNYWSLLNKDINVLVLQVY